ncbi:hypothetical protein D3C72_2236170 [compost metagenome]
MRPSPAPRLSAMLGGLEVAGIAAVTAGWLTMNFRNSWAHEPQSISPAHGGSGRSLTARKRRPS